MWKRKVYRTVRSLGLLSVAMMLLLAGCSLGDYPALLQGCTLFTGQIGAPNVPTGPSSGDINVFYTFSSAAVDPQGGDVSIQFDWGDGTVSAWSAYVASGAPVSMSHSYSAAGTFQVKARAKDQANRESIWSGAHAIAIGGGGATGEEGTVKWQWTADAGVTGIGYTSAVGADGTIYVVAGSPIKLFAISPAGSLLWSTQEMDFSPYSMGERAMNYPVIAADGTIYVVGYYKLYAFNPNGTQKWEWTTPENGDPYPHAQICCATLGPDGTIYIAHCGGGAYHRHLFAINPNGSIKWAKDLAEPNIGNGAKALTVGKNGVLYTLQYAYQPSGRHWSLFAYNSDNGAVLWNVDLGGYDVNTNGFAIGSDGTIYVPSYSNGGRIFAISSNGAIVWEYDGIPTPGIPSIGSDSTIYVVGSSGYVDGDLYALTSSGVLKWHEGNTGGGKNVAVAADGTIYGSLIFAADTSFAAVNPDGSAKWTLNIPANSGSPAIASDGTIYVTTSDPVGVIAIYGSSPLAASSWSRARHDNRNTGELR